MSAIRHESPLRQAHRVLLPEEPPRRDAGAQTSRPQAQACGHKSNRLGQPTVHAAARQLENLCTVCCGVSLDRLQQIMQIQLRNGAHIQRMPRTIRDNPPHKTTRINQRNSGQQVECRAMPCRL